MALFESIKKIYDQVLAVDSVNIDDLVTKLHYRVTTTILVCYSVLLSLGQVCTFKHIISNLIDQKIKKIQNSMQEIQLTVGQPLKGLQIT